MGCACGLSKLGVLQRLRPQLRIRLRTSSRIPGPCLHDATPTGESLSNQLGEETKRSARFRSHQRLLSTRRHALGSAFSERCASWKGGASPAFRTANLKTSQVSSEKDCEGGKGKDREQTEVSGGKQKRQMETRGEMRCYTSWEQLFLVFPLFFLFSALVSFRNDNPTTCRTSPSVTQKRRLSLAWADR